MRLVNIAVLITSTVFTIGNASSEEIYLQKDTNYCVHGDGDSKGNNIHLWVCNGNDNSNWKWIDSSAGGRIELIGTNKCIHKKGSDPASNGDDIHLWDCGSYGPTGNSNWLKEGEKIRLQGTNMCLQKKGTDSASSGDNIHLWNCDNGHDRNKYWNGL